LQLWFWLPQFLRYALLSQILVIVSILWIQERILVALARHPYILTGKAMGAGAIVKFLAKISQWLSIKVRTRLGHYALTYHPRLYRRLYILFQ